MLRVSDFCQSPLGTVPSTSTKFHKRRRRRPGDDRNFDQSISEDSNFAKLPIDTDDNCSCMIGDEDACVVSVELQTWNEPASTVTPLNTSSARVPLEVLKSLMLQHGDYAFLEKYLIVAKGVDGSSRHASVPESNSNYNKKRYDIHHEKITVLEKVIVQLGLMEEEEEKRALIGARIRDSSHCADGNSSIGLCLVQPVVLANLGISPKGQWEENPCLSTNSNTTITQTKLEFFFRLRAIHIGDSDSECSCDESLACSGDEEGKTLSLPLHNTNENVGIPTIPEEEMRRRKVVAKHVVLRPLGRKPLWPFFPLLTEGTGSRGKQESIGSTEPHHRDDTSETIDNQNKSKTNLETEEKMTTTNSVSDDDNFWIFPSRSGVPLKVSTLIEVVQYKQDKSAEDCHLQTVHYYYEVLRIRSQEQQKNYMDNEKDKVDNGNEDEISKFESYGEDDDEFFYVTGPPTQFELDSEPISSLSFVRRLPQSLIFTDYKGTKTDTVERTIYDNESQTEMHGFGMQNQTTHDDHMDEKQKGMSENYCKMPSSQKIFASPLVESLERRLTDNGEQGVKTCEEFNFPPHPDWRQVAEALLHAPSLRELATASQVSASTSTAATRVLHLVGTDREHDLRSCVELAANRVGMQCLSVHGLAAFGYQHRKVMNGSNSSSSTSNITVGSPMIEQQLAGIDCAFDCIRSRRMEPCVLHFHDVDEELASSVATGDDDLRCQIEGRFWSKWMEGVSTHQRPRRMIGEEIGFKASFYDDQETTDHVDYRYTPRVLVVISTSAPLKKGPWLERLIFPTISLSYPDDLYIRYLWNHPESTVIGSNKRKDQVGSLTKEMMPMLRGRPAYQIIQLRQKMISEVEGCARERCSNGKEKTPTQNECTTQCLERLCKECDSGWRKKSSDISLISNVSWQDVGGLDHVRAEIMDAIELPLKHPQLFPKNTGRSGILLFGPPGTGKTLVAKAVATECGLPFLSVKGPELLGSYVGESEANIRRVFSSARQAASNNLPIAASILFFDEMDSLAPRRGEMNHGGGVMERVVASLLAELDGDSGDSSPQEGRVFVLGATNRPDLLDPSLLRPGRLDRLVYLGIPSDHKERTRVLTSQLRKMKLDGDAMEMASAVIERLPPRLSGADMSKLSSGAMLHALRRLCLEAEQERQQRTDGATVDEVLEEWGEERCTPVITLDDLVVASKDISPSVSEKEMKRYERLRAEHCSSMKEPKTYSSAP